jgi:hypothetical protein
MSISSLSQLLTEIEVMRECMINLGLQQGFSSLEVINMSQQLDMLLNELLHTQNIQVIQKRYNLNY